MYGHLGGPGTIWVGFGCTMTLLLRNIACSPSCGLASEDPLDLGLGIIHVPAHFTTIGCTRSITRSRQFSVDPLHACRYHISWPQQRWQRWTDKISSPGREMADVFRSPCMNYNKLWTPQSCSATATAQCQCLG